jgi:hypothetical protein
MLALARAEIFQARWTEDIHREWRTRLLEAYPDKFDEAKIAALCAQINSTVPDCLVRNYRPIIEGLTLPDKDDRHVLAAAIKTGAQVIVTCNIGDFPKEYLAEFDIEAQHPDEFLMYQKEENDLSVLAMLKEARLTYRNPPLKPAEFINKFRENDMPLTASWLDTGSFLL